MRFDGEWLGCDDGGIRPVIRAEVLGGDGVWRALELLIDTGADRTVIAAQILDLADLQRIESEDRIGGIGGLVDSIVVRTQFRMIRDDGQQTLFRDDFAACTQHKSLDMSALGRDILDMFALIVDRHRDVVAMLGGQHTYSIQQRTN